MYKTFLICLTIALSLCGCDPAQFGLYGSEPADAKPKAAAVDVEPEPEEEFRLMSQYSKEDLEAVDGFIKLRAAIGAVEKSIENHPKQNIKTGTLFGGVALLTEVNSAYWYQDGTLYSVNPFARAYSPELPKAPAEITESNVHEAIKLSAVGSAGKPRTASDQFSEFMSLVDFFNTALTKKDAAASPYTYDFVNELTLPLTDEIKTETLNQFRTLFGTIASEQAELYASLNVAQSLSIYTYGRVASNMSHAQVAAILGDEGKQLDSTEKGDDTIALYTWGQEGTSSMYAFFENDKLSQKVIVGYN